MSEQTDPSSSGHGTGQGRDAAAGTSPSTAPRSEAERMARKLVQDVAAYEVDPPPPARAVDDGEQSGEAAPRA